MNAAHYLASKGLVDKNKFAITGGSAGGYTTLAALVFSDTFHVGASHYGVSELAALVEDTHKFEARYLDNLIGPYPQEKALYHERSPLYHIDKLNNPVIFFQGDEDKIVLPNQAEMMFSALQKKGVLSEYWLFQGEQHGFRKAENRITALEKQREFFLKVFEGKVMMTTPLTRWAEHAYQLAVQAGSEIMHYYAQTTVETEYKQDNSPLTAADKAAHELIYQGLKEFILDEQGAAPVLSEEGKHIPFIERQHWQRYWCVDPLDGTREFLAHNDEFVVNIALIANHQPIIGIIYVPAKRIGYLAWRGGGAYQCIEETRERIVSKHPVSTPVRVVVSRHCDPLKLQPWLVKLGQTQVEHQGSAWKFGRLAAGEADLIMRLSPTNEWDNAAGHCIVEEAGGAIICLNGEPLEYNRSGSTEQGHFIAVADKSIDWLKLLHHV